MSVFDKAYNAIKKRHPDIPQDPLPLELSAEAVGFIGEARTKRRGPRSVRWEKCPKCLNDKAIGVIRLANGDEVFRDHNKVLHSGKRIPCSNSGGLAPESVT